MLPNFLVVGAQKAATTSIHNYLVQHPDIYLPAKKESKFFIEDRWYDKGIDFYEKEYFSDWKGEAAIGEVDPDYMYFDNALDRIAEKLDLASIKFIFLLRNPIDRAFSHYLMTYRRGRESLRFQEALAQESTRIESGGYDEKAHYSYASRGLYFCQIERFLSRINRSQMLFLFAEDLKSNPDESLKNIFDFLNVRNDFIPPSLGREFHTAAIPHSMSLLKQLQGESVGKDLVRLLIPFKGIRRILRKKIIELNQTKTPDMVLEDRTREYLANVFRDENYRLAQFLGRDLSHWDN